MLDKLCASMALLAILTACSPQPAAEKAASPKPAAAAQSPAVVAQADDDEDNEPNLESNPNPSEFEAMSPGEMMYFVPPLGPNGETRYLTAGSTTASAFTGDVTLAAIPAEYEAIKRIDMTSKLGLQYELESVRDGGFDAVGHVDWSHLMLNPVKFAYSTGNASDPDLVFVWKVIKETVPRGSLNGGLCPKKTGYLAFNIDYANQNKGMTIAAFSEGPWPPVTDDRLCGAFNYGAALGPYTKPTTQ